MQSSGSAGLQVGVLLLVLKFTHKRGATLCSAAAAGALTAVRGLLVAHCVVGGEAGRAGHAGTLLLEARRVGVHRADGGSHSVVGVNGIEEAGILDCRQQG